VEFRSISDQELAVQAVSDAQRILEEHLQLTHHDYEGLLDRLIEVIERPPSWSPSIVSCAAWVNETVMAYSRAKRSGANHAPRLVLPLSDRKETHWGTRKLKRESLRAICRRPSRASRSRGATKKFVPTAPRITA
jgi:hypothetical protein